MQECNLSVIIKYEKANLDNQNHIDWDSENPQQHN